jgi:hypothetical protein
LAKCKASEPEEGNQADQRDEPVRHNWFSSATLAWHTLDRAVSGRCILRAGLKKKLSDFSQL